MSTSKIIIDGYNYIWAIQSEYPISRANLKRERDRLISTLHSYYQEKHIPVTVVFDGGKGGELFNASDYVKDISIIYSRQGETADEVIMRMVKRDKGSAIVVTSDNEIIRYVTNKGAAVIKCREFYKKVKLAATISSVCREDDIYMKDREDDLDRPLTTKKKGNPKKLSRSERQRRKRLNKL